MPHAIRIHRTGGPEVMQWEEIEVPPPGPGQVRLRQTAVGLNFIDTYHRTGLYPLPLPAVLGREGAGTIVEVAPDVADLHPGDRVAYALSAGAYAEERTIDAKDLVRLPDGVDDRLAAAMMLKGLTAWYLVRECRPLRPGATALIHAAAGGVGSIACQWAAHLGATVIGTAGSDAKAERARRNGCHDVVVTSREDFRDRVRELTAGRGVDVVYDSIGRDTFARSLECLVPRGMLVLFGQSSGPVPPFDPGLLASRGSLFLTRPTLQHYIPGPAELRRAAGELFDLVARDVLDVDVAQTYPLADAARAHRDLEARRTVGSTVLVP